MNDNTRGSIYDTSITRIVRYSVIYSLSHPTPEQIREMGRVGSINDLIRPPRPFIYTSVCTYHSLGEWQRQLCLLNGSRASRTACPDRIQSQGRRTVNTLQMR
jgi:hypothetical protein